MADNIHHFEIDKGTSNTGPWTSIANPVPGGGTARSYDTPLLPGTTYYRNTGVTANGIRFPYNIVSASASASGSCMWSRYIGGSTSSTGTFPTACASDAAGNIAVVGFFYGTISAGAGQLVPAAGGAYDMFVAKFNSAGTCQWSKRFGASSDDKAFSVVIDSQGDVVLGGFIVGTVDFGNGYVLTASGSSDAVLVKLSGVNGACAWAKRFGSSGLVFGNAVKVDRSDNVIFTGSFGGGGGGAVNFGGSDLSATGDRDIFLAKYAASGVHTWSKRFGGTGRDEGKSLAVDLRDNNNSIVVGGRFSNQVNFGDGNRTSSGYEDAFVAKYDLDGNLQWAKTFGSSGGDICNGVAVDTAGRVVAVGGFNGTMTVDGRSLTAHGPNDWWMIQWSDSGIYAWALNFGTGLGNDTANAVASDAAGNVFVTGAINGSIDFGGGYLLSTGSVDVYIASFTLNGGYRWAQRFGAQGDDYGTGISVAGDGNVSICGQFSGSVNFGDQTLNSTGIAQGWLTRFTP